MNEEYLKKACSQLMQTADLVMVSTIDEKGYPQTRAMCNLYNISQFVRLQDYMEPVKNNFQVYLATNRESVKMEQLKANSKICLYYCRYPATHGIALSGNIEIVNDPEIKKILWQDDWAQVYAGGLEGDDYTVLSVKPFSARGWFKDSKFEFNIS